MPAIQLHDEYVEYLIDVPIMPEKAMWAAVINRAVFDFVHFEKAYPELFVRYSNLKITQSQELRKREAKAVLENYFFDESEEENNLKAHIKYIFPEDEENYLSYIRRRIIEDREQVEHEIFDNDSKNNKMVSVVKYSRKGHFIY